MEYNWMALNWRQEWCQMFWRQSSIIIQLFLKTNSSLCLFQCLYHLLNTDCSMNELFVNSKRVCSFHNNLIITSRKKNKILFVEEFTKDITLYEETKTIEFNEILIWSSFGSFFNSEFCSSFSLFFQLFGYTLIFVITFWTHPTKFQFKKSIFQLIVYLVYSTTSKIFEKHKI